MKITLDIPDAKIRKIMKNFFPNVKMTKARLEKLRQVLESQPVDLLEAYIVDDNANGGEIAANLWGCPL